MCHGLGWISDAVSRIRECRPVDTKRVVDSSPGAPVFGSCGHVDQRGPKFQGEIY